MAARIPKSLFSSLAVYVRQSAYRMLNYRCYLLNTYQVAVTSNPASQTVLPTAVRVENYSLTVIDGGSEAQEGKLTCPRSLSSPCFDTNFLCARD